MPFFIAQFICITKNLVIDVILHNIFIECWKNALASTLSSFNSM